MNIKDVYSHPKFNKSIDKMTGFKTCSAICCTVKDMAGKSVAVLQVRKASFHFSNSLKPLLACLNRHLLTYWTSTSGCPQYIP
jgi:hypothetical protein